MRKSYATMQTKLAAASAGAPEQQSKKLKTDEAIVSTLATAKPELTELLAKLARDFKEIKFLDLIKQRETDGFNHFIFDLKDAAHNSSGTGWHLNNGMLHIDFSHFNHPETLNDVHALLNEKFKDVSWYQVPNFSNFEQGYGLPIKTLGKNGKNNAIDAILLIQNNDGSVSVLSGQRPVSNEYCLPGGMNESNVIQTCINELLEECFSGALFTPNSKSEAALDHAGIVQENLITAIHTHLPEALKGTFDMGADSPSAIVNKAIKGIVESSLDEGKKAPLIAHIRCNVYKTFLPTQYRIFTDFVNQQFLKHFGEVSNTSDPRNTDAAYMVTKPLPCFLQYSDFDRLTIECDLDLAAGDDLGNVRFRAIDVFCGHITSSGTEANDEIQGCFTAHASLMLGALHAGLTLGKIMNCETLQAQIDSIMTNHLPLLEELASFKQKGAEAKCAAGSALTFSSK